MLSLHRIYTLDSNEILWNYTVLELIIISMFNSETKKKKSLSPMNLTYFLLITFFTCPTIRLPVLQAQKLGLRRILTWNTLQDFREQYIL